MTTRVPHQLATEVGQLLRLERERAGLTQEALARRIGSDQNVISRIERGGWSPRLSTVERLFAALGLRLNLTAEPAWQRIDAQIDGYADLTLQQRVAETGLDLVLDRLAELPCVIEGLAAALLHGVPVAARAVDLAIEEQRLELLAEWIERNGALRWNERWQDFGYQERDPRVAGPMRWRSFAGEISVRVVERLPAAISILVGDRTYPVKPLTEIELTDPATALILDRVRQRRGPALNGQP